LPVVELPAKLDFCAALPYDVLWPDAFKTAAVITSFFLHILWNNATVA